MTSAEAIGKMMLQVISEVLETGAPLRLAIADSTGATVSVVVSKAEDETFAFTPVPPCDNCGEAYDPKCYAPGAPPNAVSCRKDVHCPLWDGHTGDCTSLGPRACTT
jgi:hypothetical protein